MLRRFTPLKFVDALNFFLEQMCGTLAVSLSLILPRSFVGDEDLTRAT